MAHGAQQFFFQKVREYLPWYFSNQRVLEIGSLNINGTVRDYFTDCDYIGVDVAPGPCVDMVAFGQDLGFPDGSFDVTMSTEVLEHTADWQAIMENKTRMVHDGGLMLMTCAGEGRPEHGTSRSDVGSSPLTVALGLEYYGNRKAADFDEDYFNNNFVVWNFYENPINCDLYFAGLKAGLELDDVEIAQFNKFDIFMTDWVKNH